ncbi:uncharacterized protein LOC124822706 [Vigna umbellata]|uniref:uncharacterized protein LOC124822706 n=1 Tax=Vigna umbellata TaxID=87088 RepID=UPI001F5E456F|nr:uncharacterized protein LOC124822706 [Vigna umbellata]
MDRSWINLICTTNEYENGVEQFIEFAKMNVPDNNERFYCPCVNCLNERKLSAEVIQEHVLCDGFLKSYTKWTWHGELIDMPSVSDSQVEAEQVDLEMSDRLEDMIHGVEPDSFQHAHLYDNLCTDAKKPLYPECTKYTRFSVVLKLFNVKARNGWIDKSFTELLELLSDMLPEGNTLPTRNYDAKKILCPMDGMNPYGNLSSKHSSWPVMLIIYNLPSWLCMKRKYVMLSLMISGPRQPGNDIVIYLAPLVEDLKMLWEEGVDMFDGYIGDSFDLHAMLFCTINDFPAYGNLSGYSTKGHKASPICEEGTCHRQLHHGRKTVYLGHRRFLTTNNPYRKLKKAFNGCQENELAPMALSGSQVYEHVKALGMFLERCKKKALQATYGRKGQFSLISYIGGCLMLDIV